MMTKEEKAEYDKKYREKNKDKIKEYCKNYKKLHRKENNARAFIGRLKNSTTPFIMENCAFCGKEARICHHENYDLPLFIYFLCDNCHSPYHRAEENERQ